MSMGVGVGVDIEVVLGLMLEDLLVLVLIDVEDLLLLLLVLRHRERVIRIAVALQPAVAQPQGHVRLLRAERRHRLRVDAEGRRRVGVVGTPMARETEDLAVVVV
jgi:hypothetical protein